ncbi:16S rRNA (adenine(1518)-N(6)/adenine(1519)-N(6))-dimethyltransferase RsmA [Nanchangia anserum]|nr:16S rRNA (adenine(1518)-N(6)/adenine(1519)-N(6))-dimethyltransferase RsmA [Nanchangia anserum]
MEPSPHVDLLTPAAIRDLARGLDIRPTKTLGQNFVHDAGTVRRIVAAAGLAPGTHVLEVGPGLGSLTLALLEADMRVSAVEIDPKLATALPRTVETRCDRPENLRVVWADALTITGAGDLNERAGSAWEPPRALVANLPYNVSVPVLLGLIEAIPELETALVMVQREVAERLCAGPGSRTYGVPSAKLAWYGEARLAGNIGRSVFWPEPHVDSALVKFQRRPRYEASERFDTFSLIDQAFAQRRKTLRKALADLCGGADRAAAALESAGIDQRSRGEALGIDDFVRLARAARPGRVARASAGGKINLLLDVARPDERGYHPLRSLFCGLDLIETVTVTPRLGERVDVTTRCASKQIGDLAGLSTNDHLAVRAVRAALARCGRQAGFHLDVDKHVPVAGGMAGGSADAAAALRAAREAFDLDLSDDDLHEIARDLGADVAFGLVGGLALGLGYGDVVTPLGPAPTRTFVLAINERGLSTPEVFAAFDASGAGRAACEDALSPRWMQALADPDPSALGELVSNDLTDAALSLRPDLREIMRAGDDAGAVCTFVSGSGPTIVALARDDEHAAALARALAAAPGVAATVIATGPVVPGED